MKKTLINFSMAFFISLLLGILISFILAILKVNNVLSYNASNICITSLSILIFFLFGFLFSFKQKKRGLINALILTLLYIIIFFILNSFNKLDTPVYLTISRIGSIFLGSIFGVNLHHPSN